MTKVIREIYEMHYGRDYNEDGTMRPNKHLGRFEVDKIELDDVYSEKFIGDKIDIKTNIPTGKMFKIVGREKTGIGGGTRYSVTPVCLCETCGQPLPTE